jgi:hypothetical protein
MQTNLSLKGYFHLKIGKNTEAFNCIDVLLTAKFHQPGFN